MAREEYIRIYRSDVAGATPSLTSGEIAANLVDGKLFIGGTNGSLIQFTTDSYSVTGVNGLTGNVSITGDGGAVQGKLNNTITTRLTTAAGATGLASFRDTHFLVDATGHVQLAAAYQATGDTVITVAGSGIGIVTSGKTDTLYNIGVTSFNGLTGNVSLTGDGGAVQGKLNNTITTRLTTAAGATGLASFRDTHFLVDATGHVQLAVAYQATGDTVITVVGSGIGIVTNGRTDTLYNIGVTGIGFGNNDAGLTGKINITSGSNITLFRSAGNLIQIAGGTLSIRDQYGTDTKDLIGGGLVVITGGTAVSVVATQPNGNPPVVSVFAQQADTAGTLGVSWFNDSHFFVRGDGRVALTSPYQVTGDTIVAGSAINFSQSGTTKTINNIGVTAFNGLTGNVSLTGDGGAVQGKLNNSITVRVVGDNAMTGVASFDASHFAVGSSGHVRSKGVITINSQAPDANGNFTVAAATVVTGDGGAIQGEFDAFITARLSSYTLTGVASYDPRFFGIGSTGHLVLTGAYQVTGDTVQAGSGIVIGTGKVITNSEMTDVTTGTLNS